MQCKHWRSKSIPDDELSRGCGKMVHWEPPAVDVLVFATSGRFTADAVKWAEVHNHGGKRPKIEL